LNQEGSGKNFLYNPDLPLFVDAEIHCIKLMVFEKWNAYRGASVVTPKFDVDGFDCGNLKRKKA